MKRIISLLIAVIMLSSTLISVSADEIGYGSQLKRDDVVNYVVENGISKSSDLNQKRNVTRGEVAGMLGRAIGVADTANSVKFNDVSESDANFKEIAAMNEIGIITGNDGSFRPNDTITRQEFAVIIERIYKKFFDMFEVDEKYHALTYVDLDQISEWAKQSVINVGTTGVMLAREGKRFAPLENVNFYELAYAAKSIHTTHMSEYIYTVSDTDIDPTKEFSIYQKGYEVASGLSGFGMLARFSGGPGKIYIARTTTKPVSESTTGTGTDPVSFARIINPEGYVVARVDLNYLESGKMAKIINIPDGSAGIWQIQVVNGRTDDLIEIGINGASSWGVRGEPYFKTSETTPKEMYFWVPKKFTNAMIGSTASFTIKDLEDNVVASSSAQSQTFATNVTTASNLKADNIYKLCLSNMDKKTVCVKGVPKLMSPTPEMAKDLMGGYVYSEDGLQCHGPLEAKARNAALKLYDSRDGDFSIIEDRPEELPTDIKSNLLAEAKGIQAIDMIYNSIIIQSMNRESPYLGMAQGGTEEQIASYSSWEAGDYRSTTWNGTYLLSAYGINSELNYFYGDDAIRDRMTMAFLYGIYTLEDIHTMYDKGFTDCGHHYYYTHSNFYLEYITVAFLEMKDYLEPEYRDIIQEGIEQMTDKMMQARGNGPSNQYTHGVISAMNMYLATGEERYHTAFKRGVRFITRYNGDKGNWEIVGQADAGYYLEQGGCDGNYEHMNDTFFSAFWADYCKSEMADPETVKVIEDSINRMLKFHSYFQNHRVSGLNGCSTSHYTSRTDSTIQNRGGQFGYSSLAEDFPIAKAMWENTGGGGSSWGTIFPHLIGTEEGAMETIKKIWDGGYGHFFDNSTRRSGGTASYYKVLDRNKMVDRGALPCDSESEVFTDNPGVGAISNKGTYVSTFYNSTRNNSSIAGRSRYGGPSMLSTASTSGVISSIRHQPAGGIDGAITNDNEVVSSSVYGITYDGKFYCSGKEALKLEELENGKGFKTFGTIPDTNRTLNWIYEMTDDGVAVSAKIDGIKSGDNLWLNLPIQNQTAEGFEFKDEAGKLTMSYKGKSTVITWNEALEYKLVETTDKVSVKRLRIKIPSTGEVRVEFKAQ